MFTVDVKMLLFKTAAGVTVESLTSKDWRGLFSVETVNHVGSDETVIRILSDYPYVVRFAERKTVNSTYPSVHCKHVDNGMVEELEKPFLYMTTEDDVELTVMVMKNSQCIAYEVIEAQHLGSYVDYAVTRCYHQSDCVKMSVHYEEQDCMTLKVVAPEGLFVQVLERRLS